MEYSDDIEDLNMEIILKENKIRFSHVFDYDMDTMYHYYIIPENFQAIQAPFMTHITCLQGENKLNAVGSKFEMIWKGVQSMKVRIEKTSENEFFKTLRYKVYSIMGTDFTYFASFSFYKISTNNSTCFTHELMFESPQALSFFRVAVGGRDSIAILKNMNEFYYKHVKNIEHYDSIIVNSDFEKVWASISDMERFAQHVPFINNSFCYPNDNRRNVLVNGDGEVYKLKVNSCIKDCNKGEYSLGLLRGNTSIPSQTVSFIAIDMGDNQTLMSFKHVISKLIGHEDIELLTENKKDILFCFKNSIENSK
jgi:hypothetical protein